MIVLRHATETKGGYRDIYRGGDGGGYIGGDSVYYYDGYIGGSSGDYRKEEIFGDRASDCNRITPIFYNSDRASESRSVNGEYNDSDIDNTVRVNNSENSSCR
jgi:hypothetical protein